MASTSLYRIAEQCKHTLGKGDIQSFIPFVISAYGQVAKKMWFENTNFEGQEINGSWVSEFTDIVPVYDTKQSLYYVTIPSSYLELPHEMGIDYVGYVHGGKGFIRVNNWSLFIGLKSSVLGGRQPYFVKGKKMYFPKMNNGNAKCLLLRLAIALDVEDVQAELNIGQNMVNDIITIVMQMFVPTPKITPETLT